MCMKNVNLNLLYCDIIASQDGSSISLGNISGKQHVIIIEESRRKTSQIALAMFISATQTKEPEESAQIDPDVTFSFDECYDIKIRLTETVSGAFRDLDDFTFVPSKYAVTKHLCRKTLNHTRLCIFGSIELPEENTDENFAIKALIRRHDTCRVADDGWLVQSILPLKLFNAT